MFDENPFPHMGEDGWWFALAFVSVAVLIAASIVVGVVQALVTIFS